MTGSHSGTRHSRAFSSALLALGLAGAVVLSGCAPEPGTGADMPDKVIGLPDTSDKTGGQTGSTGGSDASGGANGGSTESGSDAGAGSKGDQPGGGSSWSSIGDQSGLSEKHTSLPATFPSEAFAVPADAVVDDANEQPGEGRWFLVLRAPNQTEADRLWQRIVADNGFSVEEQEPAADGGRVATLTSARLVVDALTMPGQSDGSVLLNYVLSARTGV